MSSRYLILGANGQLGTALKLHYPSAVALSSKDLDICDANAVLTYDWSNIDVIFNAAAYTDVDRAESQQGRAESWKVNALAVANLAKVSIDKNITLVHISSDYVFDGTISPHTEDEPFTPLSAYGSSKAAGDLLAMSATKIYVMRTTWVIGDGKNFVRTMLGLAGRGISPTVVCDQIGRLTFTGELTRAIDHLITTNAPYGVYNVTNSGTPSSWANITRAIFSASKYEGLTVTDSSTEDYYAGKIEIAKRPLESTLELSKIHSTGFASRDWETDLIAYIEKEERS